MHRLTPILARAALLLAIALAGGCVAPLTVADEDRCETLCPDDGPDGECPPGCDDCTCCSGLPTVLAGTPRVHVSRSALRLLLEEALDEGRGPDGVSTRIFRPPRSFPS